MVHNLCRVQCSILNAIVVLLMLTAAAGALVNTTISQYKPGCDFNPLFQQSKCSPACDGLYFLNTGGLCTACGPDPVNVPLTDSIAASFGAVRCTGTYKSPAFEKFFVTLDIISYEVVTPAPTITTFIKSGLATAKRVSVDLFKEFTVTLKSSASVGPYIWGISMNIELPTYDIALEAKTIAEDLSSDSFRAGFNFAVQSMGFARGSSNASAVYYCQAGSFSATRKSPCMKCQKGRYSSKDAIFCAKCPKGTFALRQGSKSCTKCAKGKYGSKGGASLCLKCPKGKSTKWEGASSKSSCSKHS